MVGFVIVNYILCAAYSESVSRAVSMIADKTLCHFT